MGISTEQLKSLKKDKIPETAEILTASDLKFLVDALEEKEDKVRYPAFLLMLEYSSKFAGAYLFWGEFEKKLVSPNSFQRSIGLKLIAENVKWDKEGKFARILSKYLAGCVDEKFITARQAVQALANVVQATNDYNKEIKQGLNQLNLDKYKESQRKLLKKDIAGILALIG
jgi:hypothetical protein